MTVPKEPLPEKARIFTTLTCACCGEGVAEHMARLQDGKVVCLHCFHPVSYTHLVIQTNSPRVRQARKTNLRLILSQHNSNCTVCVRSGNCQLQKLSNDLNIHYQPYAVQPERSNVDLSVPIVREASKCIKCMRCIQVCDKIQGMQDVYKRQL